jgi:hypothetical protein
VFLFPLGLEFVPSEELVDRLFILWLLLRPFMLDKLPPKELLGDGFRLSVFTDVECSSVDDMSLKRSSFFSIFFDIIVK